MKHLLRHRLVSALLASTCLTLGMSPSWAVTPTASTPAKVLIVVSGEGREQGKTRPGFEMDEFAQAWLLLRANGLNIEVASPKGGAVEADRYDPADDYNSRLAADPQALAALKQTRSTAELKASDYRAVLVMGGKGAMFDLPKDPGLHTLLREMDAQGGVIAAVCHGPAALAEVRRADGQPLVAGRRLTGFSNEEEAAFGKKWAAQFPWLLEDKLKAQGARWDEASLMMPKVVVDGRLITGQNPFSTTAMTEAVLRALGQEPKARQPFRDEATMSLAQRWLEGEQAAVQAQLAADAKAYKMELIAMLGVYQFKNAGDDASRRQALSLMRLAEPHFKHERLSLSIQEAKQSLATVNHHQP
ncbi:type 1 glutamine amidotransferase domain-containing protein [Paucibacter sp. DJ2R-2]|uniref:type 1 glutamine amidotransferase domain-containing protein n=1 Tax=Paucibacter sp. DJ2R-2 TaxID=2893558 RepID=UPI0021E387EF|nr:type 1 glutamine amidotransferase domain-containing protein [Paucibacter sp. DJ2R-2]MCV2421615.1 type 1 glutamine amidotransferase domain-containing protein [Paucibacter sp. DJ4R-1]MCV2438320.1 type 1 glutamine amidotransferase domain-containing protein [Paucibacter sp. DJ2R-2]